MARIKQLQIGGKNYYPLTVMEAVKDDQTGKNVKEKLSELESIAIEGRELSHLTHDSVFNTENMSHYGTSEYIPLADGSGASAVNNRNNKTYSVTKGDVIVINGSYSLPVTHAALALRSGPSMSKIIRTELIGTGKEEQVASYSIVIPEGCTDIVLANGMYSSSYLQLTPTKITDRVKENESNIKSNTERLADVDTLTNEKVEPSFSVLDIAEVQQTRYTKADNAAIGINGNNTSHFGFRVDYFKIKPGKHYKIKGTYNAPSNTVAYAMYNDSVSPTIPLPDTFGPKGTGSAAATGGFTQDIDVVVKAPDNAYRLCLTQGRQSSLSLHEVSSKPLNEIGNIKGNDISVYVAKSSVNGNGSYSDPFNNLEDAINYSTKGKFNIIILSGESYTINSFSDKYNIYSAIPCIVSINNSILEHGVVNVNAKVVLKFTGNSTISGNEFHFNGGTIDLSSNITCTKANSFIQGEGKVICKVNSILPSNFLKELYMSWVLQENVENRSVFLNISQMTCTLYIDGVYKQHLYGNGTELSHAYHFSKIIGTTQNATWTTAYYTATQDVRYARNQFVDVQEIKGVSFNGQYLLIGSAEKINYGVYIHECQFNMARCIVQGLTIGARVDRNWFNDGSLQFSGNLFNSEVTQNIFDYGLNGVQTPKGKKEWTAYNLMFNHTVRCKIIGNYIKKGITGMLFMGNNWHSNNLYNGYCQNVICMNYIEDISEESMSFDGAVVVNVTKIKEVNYTLEIKDLAAGLPYDHGKPETRLDIIAELTLNGIVDKEVQKYPYWEALYAINGENGQYGKVDSFSFIDGEQIIPADSTHQYEYVTTGNFKLKIRIPTPATSVGGRGGFNGHPLKSFLNPDGSINKASKAYTSTITYLEGLKMFNIEDRMAIEAATCDNIITNNIINAKGSTGTNGTYGGGILLWVCALGNTIANNSITNERIKISGRAYNKIFIPCCNNIISNNNIVNGAISIDADTAYYLEPGKGGSYYGRVYSYNNVVNNNILSGIGYGLLYVYAQKNCTITGNILNRFEGEDCSGVKLITNRYIKNMGTELKNNFNYESINDEIAAL